MTQELDISKPIDMTEEEYDKLDTTSPFIVIPTGDSGIEKEGDSVYLLVEAQMPEWKTPGTSYRIPLIVVEEGINEGKSFKDWYMGVSKDAMGINKRAAVAFGVEDKVILREGGKIKLQPMGFVGAKAKAKFKREMSNQGNLRSVLESTAFLPADTSTVESL